mgnify:CR=1 FL=1
MLVQQKTVYSAFLCNENLNMFCLYVNASYLGDGSTNGSSTPPTAAGSWVVVANRTTGAEPPPKVAPASE